MEQTDTSYIRKIEENKYAVWCVACQKVHVFNDTWTISINEQNQNITVSPSLKLTDGTGWECHFSIIDSQLVYDGSTTNKEFAGKKFPMEKF